MNGPNLQQEIRQNVLERLKRGDVRMRSRAYFIVRALLALALSVLVLLLSAYVLSFVAFSIHESGEQFLLGFGVRGVETFFVLFPWISIIIDIVLILVLEWLLQSFKFAYRISLALLFGVMIVISGLIASAIALTPLHMSLLDMADRHDLPVIGEMYEGIRTSHDGQGIFRGSIASMQGNVIVITHDDGDHDADDGTRTIVLPSGYSTSELKVGDRVYVFGTATGEVIEALGIERLSPDQ